MQRLLEFIFGKVNKDNKFLLFGYWFFVFLYFILLTFSIIQLIDWFSILLFALLFPIVFRLVYGVNSLILRKINTKGLFIVARVFGFVIICFVGLMVFLSDNVAINANKSISNGNVQLSIDKLKGNYQVAEFDVNGEGMISLPYKASVSEGDIVIFVERESEVLWEESISTSGQGNIQFHSEVGTYDIQVVTEEANDVFVELSNPK
ncbi:hypothetical protein [Halalkalibacter urbisdiaboli]|uniref:hypothetical protein n=1 Tax=Halalkalibacter urbisdiaboli TaxID=1960589 RepID=UPI000B433601|nr:hypothetical protein [Halalkalibacter urbisdiaboli]